MQDEKNKTIDATIEDAAEAAAKGSGARKLLSDKRLYIVLGVIVIALLILWSTGQEDDQSTGPIALPVDSSMRFEFNVAGNGMHQLEVSRGDIITVEYKLYRLDANEDFPVYAVQNEIEFDTAAFRLIEDSIQSAYTTSVHQLDGGGCRVFMNTFSSGPDGFTYGQGAVFGSFQLEVLANEGTYEVTSNDYEMSCKGGESLYEAVSNDLSVTVK